MELIRGLSGLRPRHQGSVVTIGTFDGIHPGHRALIDSLLAHGRRLGRPAMMLTFEPMPREYLAAANPPARLTSWRERWRVLQRTGLSYVLQLKSDLETLNNVAAGREERLRRWLLALLAWNIVMTIGLVVLAVVAWRH